jgi:putative N6-adenine-specific DNA methylase
MLVMSEPSQLRWLATCPADTRDVLLAEVQAMGVSQVEPLHRGVAFSADLATGYRAHLWLRTASRLQRIVGDVPARSVRELADAVGRIDWRQWLRGHRPFQVSAILTDNPARALGEAAVVEAVAHAVGASFGEQAPRYDSESEQAMTVVAHLREGVCTLGLDTAGRALHKRGWRLNGHPAVIKETLAAAILLMAGYDGTVPLLDPMCGSGTIAIEAAYIALNKAPLIHRGKDDFALEHQAGFDRALWRRIGDEARAAKRPAPPAPIFASDIRQPYVDLARQGALRARVEKHIHFSTSSFQSLPTPAGGGLLVTNLPYGQRIGRGELQALYTGVARKLHERYRGWRVALLATADAPRHTLGLRAAREIPLMNGALPVHLILAQL